MKNNTISRIIGMILMVVFGIVVYGEYKIYCAMKGIATWIVQGMGITESATGGVMILLYVPIIGLMIVLALVMGLSLYYGIVFLRCKAL